MKAFEVSALDFIQEPVSISSLIAAVEKLNDINKFVFSDQIVFLGRSAPI